MGTNPSLRKTLPYMCLIKNVYEDKSRRTFAKRDFPFDSSLFEQCQIKG